MPTSIFINALAAAAAATSVAMTSFIGVNANVYDGADIQRFSQSEAIAYAGQNFVRGDRNEDGVLNVDEFAALSVVTSELAHLNGFIAVEKGDRVETIAFPLAAPVALGDAEHTRIDAVARHSFYAFSGADGKMQKIEYQRLQSVIFANSDRNGNGALVKDELLKFVQQQTFSANWQAYAS